MESAIVDGVSVVSATPDGQTQLRANGSTIVETPIIFRDRQFGTSKMSGRIIAESMLLVTKWGLFDRKNS